MRGTPAGSQSVLTLGFAARLILGLAITAVVGRVLEPAEFGFFTLVASLFVLTRFLFDLGTGAVAVREIACDSSRERPLLEGLVGWRRLCGLVLGIAVLGFAWSESDPRRRQVLFGVAVSLPFLAPGALAPVFTLRQAQLGPAVLRTLGQLGVLAGAGLLHAVGVAGAAFAWLLVGRELWNVAGVHRLARRVLDYRPVPGLRGRGLRPFFSMALVQGSAMLFLTAIFHAEVFLVRGIRGEVELGAYAAAFRPVQPLIALPSVLLLPVLPLLAAAAARDRTALRALTGGLMVPALAAGVACAVLGALLAPAVLHGLYGGSYVGGPLDAVEALRWLALALGLAVAAGPLAAAVSADRGERVLLWIYAASFALNVLGNLTLLPVHGFVAAAHVMAATQGAILFLLVVAALRRGALGAPLGPGALWRELRSVSGEGGTG